MRVCLVVDSLDIGGAERHVIDLARSLDRRGHEVTLACSVGGPLAGHLAGTNVRVLPLLHARVKRSVSPLYAQRLGELIARGRFDLLHAHMYASEAAAALAASASRTPLVLTEHSEGRWQGERERAINRRFVCRADRAIAVSRGIERRLVEELEAPRGRVSLIPNAAAPPTALDRCSAGIPTKPAGAHRLVGVVARLSPEKGHGVFLDAAARVAPLVPEASFLVVGDGPLRGALERQAHDLGLDRRVLFLGERANARAIMAPLDILAVPSLAEGTPLAVLEALAHGVPIVAGDVGDIARQIRHEREGLLVPPGDGAALAEALLSLLRDENLRARLARGAAARHDPRAHDAAVERTLEVYRSGCRPAVGPRRPYPLPV